MMREREREGQKNDRERRKKEKRKLSHTFFYHQRRAKKNKKTLLCLAPRHTILKHVARERRGESLLSPLAKREGRKRRERALAVARGRPKGEQLVRGGRRGNREEEFEGAKGFGLLGVMGGT